MKIILTAKEAFIQYGQQLANGTVSIELIDDMATVFTGDDLPDNTPILPSIISAEEFRKRFTDIEIMAFLAASKTDDNIELMSFLLQTNTSGIDLQDTARTLPMIAYLVSKAVISQERANIILKCG